MKKTIAILLILVIGMVGVFAEGDNPVQGPETDTLRLYTEVIAKYGLVISDASADDVSDFEALDSIGEVGFMTEDNESLEMEKLYVNYMTNQKIAVVVSTTMYPLSNDDVTSMIGYTVVVDDATDDIEVANDSTGELVKFFEESGVSQGMRVVSKEFSITLDQDDWDAATAAKYETTWVVTLSVI